MQRDIAQGDAFDAALSCERTHRLCDMSLARFMVNLLGHAALSDASAS